MDIAHNTDFAHNAEKAVQSCNRNPAIIIPDYEPFSGCALLLHHDDRRFL
jgi:hypothetical protein